MTTLFLLLLMGSASGSLSAFQRIDDIILADGVLHLVAHINISALQEEVDVMNAHIKATHELHKGSRSRLILALLTDMGMAQNGIKKDFQRITARPQERARRSPAEEIGKLVGGAFGLVSRTEANMIIDAMNEGIKTANRIALHVEHAETGLAATQEDVKFLNRSIHYMSGAIHEGVAEGRMVAHAFHLASYQERLRGRIDAAQGALNRLHDGKINSYLLPPGTAAKLIDKIQARAATRAATTPLTSPEDLYDCPTTAVATKDGWKAIVHLPLTPQKGAALIHYRFLGAAFTLPDGSTAIVSPEGDQHFAMSRAEDSAFVTEGPSMREQCYKMANNLVCPQDLFIELPPKETCLGALLLDDMAAARAWCPLAIMQTPYKATALGQGQFALLTRSPRPYTLICNGSKIGEHRVTTFHILRLNHTCKAKWGAAWLHGPVQDQGNMTVATRHLNHTRWNDTALFQIGHTVEERIDAMLPTHEPEAVPVMALYTAEEHRRLHQEQLDHIKGVESSSWWTSVTGISISSIAVLILTVVLLLLLCQFCKAIR